MALRVGLVGAGWWAKTYHVPALLGSPDAEIAVVCDLDIPSAQSVAAVTGARVCGTVEEMVDAGVDAVVISTPNAQHRPPVLAALSVGLPVLVEKPLATTAADAFEIVRTAERAGVALMVGHTHQFDGAADLAYRAVREGIGELVQVTAEFSSGAGRLYSRAGSPYARPGGGHALTQLVHAIGMVCWTTGEQLAQIAGLAPRRGLDVDVDDAAAFVLGSGATGVAVGTGSASERVGHHQQVRYVGTDGMVVHDMLRARTRWTRSDASVLEHEPDQHTAAYAAQEPARQFVELVLRGGPNRGPARPAAAAVAAVETLLRSAEAQAVLPVPQLPDDGALAT